MRSAVALQEMLHIDRQNAFFYTLQQPTRNMLCVFCRKLCFRDIMYSAKSSYAISITRKSQTHVCLSLLFLLCPVPLRQLPITSGVSPISQAWHIRPFQSAFSLCGEPQFFFLFWGTVNSSFCLKSCSLPNRPYACSFTPLQSVFH